jgi:CRISPR-associated exonuclease Cas4
MGLGYLTLVLAGLLLLAALAALWISNRQRGAAGLPAGQVIYSDTDRWNKVEKPLYDPVSGLTGKPDYLVEEKGRMIPVEVKSGRAPTLPYDSHVFQVAAYCLLVERSYGKRPPYAILHYRDRTFSIAYTPALRAELEELLDEMRRQEKRGEASRSHQEAGRCARCGFRDYCDERL